MAPRGLREIELHKRRMLNVGKVLNPASLIPNALKFVPFLDYLTRVQLDAVSKPQLAYGVYAAGFLAKCLGLPAVSVIEFGVASGSGLVAMEQHAEKLSEIIGIDIQVYGFDRAEGLFETSDPKDIPFWFRPGFFKVDPDAVRKRLKKAKYIVGEIAETLPAFVAGSAAPVGFVSIDVDFYVSAKDCLRLFEQPASSRLPRVLCYLNDIFGTSDLTVMSRHIGEMAAVDEWNAAHPDMRIEKVEGLSGKRPFARAWNEKFYCLHDFSHPDYIKGVNDWW